MGLQSGLFFTLCILGVFLAWFGFLERDVSLKIKGAHFFLCVVQHSSRVIPLSVLEKIIPSVGTYTDADGVKSEEGSFEAKSDGRKITYRLYTCLLYTS